MAIEAFAARLADLEIFRGLKDAQIAVIARGAERMMFRPGQTIIAADKAGDAAYIVMGGDAVVAGNDTATEIVPGTLVGEMAMLIEHRYRLTVVARGNVKALKLSRSTLHELMAADPTLAEHFVQCVSSRLTRVALELRRIDENLALAAELAPIPSLAVISKGFQPHA